MIIFPDDKRLTYSGRIDWRDEKAPVFIWPCTFVAFGFTGETLKVRIRNKRQYWGNQIGYILDGVQGKIKLPQDGEAICEIPVNGAGRHEVMIFKRQDSCHKVTLLGFEIADQAEIFQAEPLPKRKIEVYGDSVSAGEVSEAVEYTGKADPEHDGEYSNSWYSYAWITARKLHAQIHDVAQGGIALLDHTGYFCEPEYVGMESAWDEVQYNPAFGETTKWDFSKYTPDVVIVAIGQNDNHPEDYMKEDYEGEKAKKWRAHYKQFLQNIRKKYPDAYIVCITTLLIHDASWDQSISQVVEELGDAKVSKCTFKRNGSATPGHLRIPEAEEMAEELAAYIEQLHVEAWA